ncbi:NADPH:quinone reductase-like Zn-dependent oxidoreductase [Phyllobacterium trifolii]|uniref:NADPH:quinone reductase-like Zn-dependent oxidoreductase n=1 Tax=Phyllobacterium trifolii TaxID=300193 RepID=A0A839UH36_9HYPH|nr:NADPH:quinone reductase-like Zn-dependent oxidoreductase [Phyllobacterium trifolii]
MPVVSIVSGPVGSTGADHVIVDTEGHFAEEALYLTGGEGVHVVYGGSGSSFDLLPRSVAPVRSAGTGRCSVGPVRWTS